MSAATYRCWIAILAAVTARPAPASEAYEPDLWRVYHATLESARHIDLTHAFAPGQAVATGFGDMKVAVARAAVASPSWPFGVTMRESPGAPPPMQSRPLSRGADGILRRRGHVLRRRAQMIAVPAGIHFVERALKQRTHDFLLVAEIVVEVALADPTVRGNAVCRYGRRAVLIEQLQSRIEYPSLRIAINASARSMSNR